MRYLLVFFLCGIYVWGSALALPQDAGDPSSGAGNRENRVSPSAPRLTATGLPEAEDPPLNAASAVDPALGYDYVIGPEDVLEIDVFSVPELSKISVRVANDGTISLALLGHLRAAGMTARQLREELEAKYGEAYLENPQVTVFVKEHHAKPVSVIGAVDKPGLYTLSGPRTLVEVLSMAGGLAKRGSGAAGRTVLVTRMAGFDDLPLVEGMRVVTSDKLEIDLRRLLYSQDDALNIQIKPLDIVAVSKADIIYVVGGVRRPGGFVLEDREKVTVLQALAMAEGLAGTAAKKSARIIRTTPDGSRVEIPVNLGKVLKGKEEDVELAANDIVFVPDSTGKLALKRGIEAAIGTISGVLVYSSAR